MTGRTHKAIGICAGIVAGAYCTKVFNDYPYFIAAPAAVIGCMLPDIDHNNTKIGSKRKDIVDILRKKSTRMLVKVILLGILIVRIVFYSYVHAYIYAESGQIGLPTAILYQIGLPLILILFILIFPKIKLKSMFTKEFLRFVTAHRGIMHTLLVPILLGIGWMLFTGIWVKSILIGICVGYVSHLFADCLTITGCPVLWPFSKRSISILPVRTGTVLEYAVGFLLSCAILFIALLLWTLLYGNV